MTPTRPILAATVFALALALTSPAQAAEAEAKDSDARPVQNAPESKRPEMAEMPFMKAEAKRLATLMERLQKETDPAERRKIMAETSCAQ